MYKPLPAPIKIPLHSSTLLFFATVFLVGFGDAIMSYATPVFLESKFNSTFIMGIILSFSSLIGLVFDFIASERLKKKDFKFFIWSTVLFAIAFPLCLLVLPKYFLLFLIPMAMWGIYYELEAFSAFHFIESNVHHNQYPRIWGIHSNLRSTAYLAGPFVAALLISQSLNLPFYTALAIFLFTLLILTLFSRAFKNNHYGFRPKEPSQETVRGGLRIWRTLFKKVWVLWLFSFTLFAVDACFWSAGIIFSEELKSQYSLGELFILAYMLPGTVMGFVLPRIAEKIGKKRTAFYSAIGGGLLLFILSFATNFYLLLGLMFIAACLTALAHPALSATYEDYVDRLGLYGNEMIGLEQSSVSMAYVIGPIVFGFIASVTGTQRVFAAAGIGLLLVSVFALVVVPRKIRMPQTELNKVA